MKKFKIIPEEKRDWNSFHNTFSKIFNFPTYYGRNMNAWIDCMDEFTDELTIIELDDCRELKEKQPQIIEAILECTAFVNYRKLEANEDSLLVVSVFT